jgi:RNA polymerase primary sigma factor
MSEQPTRLSRLLKLAVIGGVAPAVRLHIDRGDDLDARDEKGHSSLMIAAARNRAEICRILLEAGADPSLRDSSGLDAIGHARKAGACEAAAAIESASQAAHRDDTAQSGKSLADVSENSPEDVSHGVAYGFVGAHASHFAADAPAAHPGNTERDSTPPYAGTAGQRAEELIYPPPGLAGAAPLLAPPAQHLDDGSALDLTGWEDEPDCPAPENDPGVAEAAAAVHESITNHRPIDSSEDWDDLELFLPSRATPLARDDDPDAKIDLRCLLMRAVTEGSVPQRDVDELCCGNDGEVDAVAAAHLRMTINDLGAEVDERIEERQSWAGDRSDSYEDGLTDKPLRFPEREAAVAEAVERLDALGLPRNEPMIQYLRDFRHAKLIDAETEKSLAKAMEEALDTALETLAEWPAGLLHLHAAAEAVRSGDRPFKSLVGDVRNDALIAGDGPDAEMYLDLEAPGGSERDPVATDAEDLEDDDDAEVASGADLASFLDRLAQLRIADGISISGSGNAQAAREVLTSLHLSRGFLVELSDVTGADRSAAAAQFRSAISVYQEARTRFALANMRLVLGAARRFYYSGEPLEDLVQEGNLGLLKAVDRFDWRRGYKFSTMALWWIRQSISRAIGDKALLIRLPIHVGESVRRVIQEADVIEARTGRRPSAGALAAALAMKVQKVEAVLRTTVPALPLEALADETGFEDPEGNDPFESVAAKQLRRALEEMLAALGKKVEEIMRLRFGFEDADPMTLEEIGMRLGLTRERIRQIEAKALKKLSGLQGRTRLEGWATVQHRSAGSDQAIPEHGTGGKALSPDAPAPSPMRETPERVA